MESTSSSTAKLTHSVFLSFSDAKIVSTMISTTVFWINEMLENSNPSAFISSEVKLSVNSLFCVLYFLALC